MLSYKSENLNQFCEIIDRAGFIKGYSDMILVYFSEITVELLELGE